MVAGLCTVAGVPAFVLYRDLGVTLMVLAAINFVLYRTNYNISVV